MHNDSTLMYCLLLLAVFAFVIYHVGMHKINNEFKNPPDTGDWVNFFDEYKEMMSSVVQGPLQYADSWLGRHVIYKYLDDKATVNGRKIDCCSVKIKFMLKIYKDGRREIHADTESHYGKPEFYNGVMHENYDVGGKSFVADVNNFHHMWKEILEYHFSVKLDGKTDKIKMI
jgi:hypothetical protein